MKRSFSSFCFLAKFFSCSEVFNDIPLCGFKTNGEFGRNVPQKFMETGSSRKRKNEGNGTVPLVYCAVFIIIGFDKA